MNFKKLLRRWSWQKTASEQENNFSSATDSFEGDVFLDLNELVEKVLEVRSSYNGGKIIETYGPATDDRAVMEQVVTTIMDLAQNTSHTFNQILTGREILINRQWLMDDNNNLEAKKIVAQKMQVNIDSLWKDFRELIKNPGQDIRLFNRQGEEMPRYTPRSRGFFY